MSQIGTWMQYVALAWGIHQLTPWPFAVSLSLVAQFAPSLLLSPIAGSAAGVGVKCRAIKVRTESDGWAPFLIQ